MKDESKNIFAMILQGMIQIFGLAVRFVFKIFELVFR